MIRLFVIVILQVLSSAQTTTVSSQDAHIPPDGFIVTHGAVVLPASTSIWGVFADSLAGILCTYVS